MMLKAAPAENPVAKTDRVSMQYTDSRCPTRVLTKAASLPLPLNCHSDSVPAVWGTTTMSPAAAPRVGRPVSEENWAGLDPAP